MSAAPHNGSTNEHGCGVPNAVRAGTIGIVGSAATAGRETAVRIHDFGGGVSRVIPVAGSDAGATAIVEGLRRLQDDPATEVIVLVVRRPSSAGEARVGEQLLRCTKPVVACFIGKSADGVARAGVIPAATTKEAALQAVLLTGRREEDIDLHALNWPLIEEVRGKLTPEQRYVRGLFIGRDLCAEAMYLAMEKYEDVYSNIHPDPARRLDVGSASAGHTFVDFGEADAHDDAAGNSDPALRVARFIQEADDPETGVVALDFILGTDAHDDPVGGMLPVIREAKERAAGRGRHLEIVAYVLGTDLDTPNLADQVGRLEAASVTIASSSANTGLLSREFVAKE